MARYGLETRGLFLLGIAGFLLGLTGVASGKAIQRRTPLGGWPLTPRGCWRWARMVHCGPEPSAVWPDSIWTDTGRATRRQALRAGCLPMILWRWRLMRKVRCGSEPTGAVLLGLIGTDTGSIIRRRVQREGCPPIS